MQLQVADIDGDRLLIHVRQSKGAKDRCVPLPAATLTLLRQQWQTYRHPQWLFPARRSSQATQPMHPSGVQRAFKAALADSGIQKKATVHTLRHSYGRPFGRLVNASSGRDPPPEAVSSPWRFSTPSRTELVSFQGT